MAAYRFFENEKTTIEKILQPRRHATHERVASQDVVLCVQDTTELDLTRPLQQIRGTGPIGTSHVRRGVYLHLLEAFTPDGTPLGTLWNKIIVRKDETPEEKKLKRKNRPIMPIDDKDAGGEATHFLTVVYASPIFATKTLPVRAGPAAVPLAQGKRDRARPARGVFLEMCKTTLTIRGFTSFRHLTPGQFRNRSS